MRLIQRSFCVSLIIQKLLVFSVFFLDSLVQNFVIISHIDNVLSSYIFFDLSLLLSLLRYEDYCKIAWRLKTNKFSISAISQVYTTGDNLLLVMYLRRTRDELSVDVQNLITLCLSTQARIGYPGFRQPRRKSGIDLGGLWDRKKASLRVHRESCRSFTDSKDSLSNDSSGLRKTLEKKRQEQRENKNYDYNILSLFYKLLPENITHFIGLKLLSKVIVIVVAILL